MVPAVVAMVGLQFRLLVLLWTTELMVVVVVEVELETVLNRVPALTPAISSVLGTPFRTVTMKLIRCPVTLFRPTTPLVRTKNGTVARSNPSTFIKACRVVASMVMPRLTEERTVAREEIVTVHETGMLRNSSISSIVRTMSNVRTVIVQLLPPLPLVLVVTLVLIPVKLVLLGALR